MSMTQNISRQNPDVTWGGLVGSLGTALVFQAFAFTAFSFLRRTKYGAQWLVPKRAVCSNKTPPDLTTETLWGWLPELWNMPEERILMYCGYDVVMFLKCLRLGFWTLFYMTPYFFLVILPTNATSKGSDDAEGFFRTTMSNIRVDDRSKLGVHVVGLCLSQAILCALTFNIHLEYIELRRAFMKQQAREATVFVTGIPERMRSKVGDVDL